MIGENYIVYYINLNTEIERKKEIELELEKIFDRNKINRFNAIKNENGHLGAALSHTEVLKLALNQDKKNIFIFEDDIKWTHNIEKIKNIIFKDYDYNIIAISYNIGYYENTLQINNIGNNIGYLIKKSYIGKLLKIWENTKHFIPKKIYGSEIDRTWNELENDGFYCFIPRLVKIKDSYSSTDKRWVSPSGYCFLAITSKHDDIYTCFHYEKFIELNETTEKYICDKYSNIDYICFIKNYDKEIINIDNLFKIFCDICYEKIDYAYDAKLQNIWFISKRKIDKKSNFEKIVDFCDVYL